MQSIQCERGPEQSPIAEAYASELPFWKELLAWAERAVPQNLSADEKTDFIVHMATKGGITEAIVNGVKDGKALRAAFDCGIARSREISASYA
jgi:pyrroline-5-carboxylate reductase